MNFPEAAAQREEQRQRRASNARGGRGRRRGSSHSQLGTDVGLSQSLLQNEAPSHASSAGL